ncbi:MAG TPA: SigE family RNA polymerase sigma factor [Nocardioides sp.]|uniref:SigE family RNA polymerase sigma factor n=1 Tax=Nocardioides sp. TaxID=35761 RepID=UPI002F3EC68B
MRALERDEEFVQYVAAYRGGFMRAARLLTAGDDAGAEDLVQSTLTSLYMAWPRVARADNPAAYGYASLTNTFLKEQRRAHRRREVVTDRALETVVDRVDVETNSLILEALRQLAPRQRAVIVLRHFLEYDVAGTAQLLGCSQGTVKSQNSKALTRLRELLGAYTITEGN